MGRFVTVVQADPVARCALSVRPRSGEQVPVLTAQVARASNPNGTTAMWARDRLDGQWHDDDFAGWYPRDGRPNEVADQHSAAGGPLPHQFTRRALRRQLGHSGV
jgi:hypothetical protein